MTQCRAFAVVVVVAVTVGGCAADRNRAEPAKPSSTSTAGARPKPAAPDPRRARVVLTPVATVVGPTALARRPGDNALYVTEQSGRVRALRNGTLDSAPILDLSDTISAGGERGLLGLTFSPNGATLYVNYTNLDGDTRVDAYPMGPNGRAQKGKGRELLAIAQPQPNHNGGTVVTGPDGMLWIGMGDGGGAGDQGDGHVAGGNGQSRTTLLGKILRIDPTPDGTHPYSIPADNPFASSGGRPEIWAYGLRNPWKFSFDATTGALVIADVGEHAYEEINWVPAGTAPPLNFGWAQREGTHPYREGAAPGAREPILDYSHGPGCSISGGYVYRGTKIPDLVGTYLFSDACDGTIRGTPVGPHAVGENIDLGIESTEVVGFGEDRDHEVYVISHALGILRIDPA